MTLIGKMFRKGDSGYLCVDSHERPFVRLQNLSSDEFVKVYLDDLEKDGYEQLIGKEEFEKLIQEKAEEVAQRIINAIPKDNPTNQPNTDEQRST